MSRLITTAENIRIRNAVIEQEIEEIYKHFEENAKKQKYPPVIRNILLVGFTRSGKTTFSMVMTDPRYKSNDISLFTGNEKKKIIKRNINISTFNTTLNTIEIPLEMIDENFNLSEACQEFIAEGIPEIHLILLCTSVLAGINGTALKSFLRFLEQLDRNEVRKNTCLLITRCESKDEQQRETIKAEVKEDGFFHKLEPYIGQGILFSGALNPDKWAIGDSGVIKEFRTICCYRQNILKAIRKIHGSFRVSCNNSMHLRHHYQPPQESSYVDYESLPHSPTQTFRDVEVAIDSLKNSVKHHQKHMKIFQIIVVLVFFLIFGYLVALKFW
jgi:hypothetical protein